MTMICSRLRGNIVTPKEERMLAAIAWMCVQYLEQDGVLDNVCMSAGEQAMGLLADYGLINFDGRCGTWTEAGKTFLAAH